MLRSIEGRRILVWPATYREFNTNAADAIAVAIAFFLPLSTSAVAVLVGLWLMALLPTLSFREVRRQLARWPGALPVLLVLFAVAGTLWADVGWSERLAGMRPLLKLLVIPLLFIQFQRSDRGLWVVYGLLAGCTLLLTMSFVGFLFSVSLIHGKPPGIVVKDYISQSGFFVLCAFLLLEMAEENFRARQSIRVTIAVLLIVAFLINIGYVAVSRTSLIVVPVLLLLFGLRRNWKIAAIACAAWALLFAIAWTSSPYLRHRLHSAASITAGDPALPAVSNRQRLAYWEASIDLIKEAPLFGHGTGTIASLFRHYTADGPESDVNRAANPHNQTFAIALQTGLMGVLVLYAMWISHALMFRGPGMAAWSGLVVLAQNVTGSLFNSHISDFTQGWTYVICIGVAGGMIQSLEDARRPLNKGLNSRNNNVSGDEAMRTSLHWKS